MKQGDTVYEKFGNCKVRIIKHNRSRTSAPSTFLVEFTEDTASHKKGDRETFGINELSKIPGEMGLPNLGS